MRPVQTVETLADWSAWLLNFEISLIALEFSLGRCCVGLKITNLRRSSAAMAWRPIGVIRNLMLIY